MTASVKDLSEYVSGASKFVEDPPAGDLTHDQSNRKHRSLCIVLNQALRSADREDVRSWYKYLFAIKLIYTQCLIANQTDDVPLYSERNTVMYRRTATGSTDRFLQSSMMAAHGAYSYCRDAVARNHLPPQVPIYLMVVILDR